MTPALPRARVADVGDLPAAAQLLYDFNLEYDDPSPPPHALSRRLVELTEDGDTLVLVAGDGPHGVAVLRFRKAIWSEGLECYLAELYVAPGHRGQGLGRELLELALVVARQRGADAIDLGTSEDDTTARRLYETSGFTNREKAGKGPILYVYERAL